MKDTLFMPVTYAELIARTKGRKEASPAERMYAALLSHADTDAWLKKVAQSGRAFEKGLTRRILPQPKYGHAAEKLAHEIVRDTIFAASKQVRGGSAVIPGLGKVEFTERDMMSPSAQYGLGSQRKRLQAQADLAALMEISVVGVEEGRARRAPEEDWAHGEHRLQDLDSELRGSSAASARNAKEALRLLGEDEIDPEVQRVLYLSLIHI